MKVMWMLEGGELMLRIRARSAVLCFSGCGGGFVPNAGAKKRHTDCENHDQKEAAEHELESSGLPHRLGTGTFVASLPCPCALVARRRPVAERDA